MTNKVKYPVKGFWRVTTEGDVEGRTIRNLGVHEGYIDDIAFKLAKQQYYGLRFDLVNPNELSESDRGNATEVNVSLGIDSDTWNLKNDDLINFWADFLKDRDVSVSDCNYYACVTLLPGKNNPVILDRIKKKIEEEREAALAKLSLRERKLLGIN